MGSFRLREVDSLGWAVGSARRMPKVIRVTQRLSCSFLGAPGDTLLVPTEGEIPSDTLDYPGCVDILRVKNGWALAFGRRLEALGSAFESGGSGLHIRR